jgi:uncharacterized protein
MATVLITGASSGLGLEFSRVFAKNGFDLVLVARNITRLEAVKDELNASFNVKIKIVQADLSRVEQIDSLYETLQAEHIDYLVNNAGAGDFGHFINSDWKRQEDIININIMALTKLTYLFLQNMAQKGSGRILNVASTSAFQPGPLMNTYYASKAYVLFFSEALSNELKGTGISVTALCSGAFKSEFQLRANKPQIKNNLPAAMEIARYGYTHLMKGTSVAVYGFKSRMMVKAINIFPRNWVLLFIRNMHNKCIELRNGVKRNH